MDSQAMGLLVAGIGAAVVTIGAAFAIAKISASSSENIGRQPEAAGPIRGTAIITAALIEGLALFALGIFFMIQFKVKL